MAITLSDIRKAADKRFAPTTIDLEDGKDPVVLLNPLRLPKELRDRVTKVSEELVDDESIEKVLTELITKVAATPAQGRRLVAAAKGDIAILMETFMSWAGDNSTGEASTSED
jgi:hypothetical protein